MRVLVCGGRDYTDRGRVFRELEAIDEECGGIEVVIDGGARGADAIGHEWAIAYGRAWERHPADWRRHGKAAGYIRNQHMLDVGRPDVVVAFPGGRGTADMVSRARKAGVRVLVVDEA